MRYILLLLNIVLISIGQLLLKKASIITLNQTLVEKILNLFFIGGLFFYGLSTLLWIKILEKIEISVAYPVMAMSYIIVTIGASLFFQEMITGYKITGIIFIIIGIIFMVK